MSQIADDFADCALRKVSRSHSNNMQKTTTERSARWCRNRSNVEIDKLAWTLAVVFHRRVNFFPNEYEMNTPFSFCLFLSLSFSFPLCFLLTCFPPPLSPSLRFSLWHKERRIAPSFGSNVPLRTSTRVQTRFHASDVDLVARSLERASRVTSVEGLRLAFPTRIALRVSYQNRVTNPAPDAAESFERIKVGPVTFFSLFFSLFFSRPLGSFTFPSFDYFLPLLNFHAKSIYRSPLSLF